MATPANYFGGSPLNRLSWLRPKTAFLNAVVQSPSAKWVLFKAGQPLVTPSSSDSGSGELAYLSTKDVSPLLGEQPWFGQGQTPGEALEQAQEGSHTEALRHRGLPIVFLGLEEPETTGSALPESDFVDAAAAVQRLEGNPFFSIDVGELEEDKVQEVLKSSEAAKGGRSPEWGDARALMTSMKLFDAAIYAEARSLVDWNSRNKFCAGCGSPQASMWAGWKLVCTSLLPWADNTGKKPCPTTRGLHNFTHPRTDPVVIMIALDQTGDKVLLGRSRKFPMKFYSALAGFIEPGESFEDAVKREMWEEAGVKVWDVTYHSGQPWPYPANLMVGFYARADSTKPVRVDLDNELVDARWYTREEIQAILRHPTAAGPLTRQENKKLQELEQGKSDPPGGGAGALAHSDPNNKPQTSNVAPSSSSEKIDKDEPPFRVPPPAAIAGVLIRDWAEGKIRVESISTPQAVKGNL